MTTIQKFPLYYGRNQIMAPGRFSPKRLIEVGGMLYVAGVVDPSCPLGTETLNFIVVGENDLVENYSTRATLLIDCLDSQSHCRLVGLFQEQ